MQWTFADLCQMQHYESHLLNMTYKSQLSLEHHCQMLLIKRIRPNATYFSCPATLITNKKNQFWRARSAAQFIP